MFYHFAKEVAVGGFFWGVLFFCSDSPPFRTITHSRFVPPYRYIRSGVAFLLEPFILLLCFLWFQNKQKKRTNPNGGWCGGAGTVYSAVPFCGVQNNQNKRVAGLFHFAMWFLHTAQMVFLSRVFRFWGGCGVVGVVECIPRDFSRCTRKIAGCGSSYTVPVAGFSSTANG